MDIVNVLLSGFIYRLLTGNSPNNVGTFPASGITICGNEID
jgi:hypothetical protein